LLLATNELMAELTRYRRHYGLAALPYGGETTPLLCRSVAPTTMTRGAVYLIIKQAMRSRTALSDGADRPVV
jgi:integrase/recombinase XerD